MVSSVAIVFEGLTKDYSLSWRGSRLRALDGLTWAVPRGEICGLLGPNGCGKSTTLNVLLALAKPTAGRCRVFGRDPQDPATRRKMGYLPQVPGFHPFLNALEVLHLHARLAGLSAARREERTEAMLDWVGLTDVASRKVSTYSPGMLRRLGLAQALVHDPELLVLDEPTAGVDPQGVLDMMRLVRKLKAAGKTVLLTSHLLPQVEELCDRVALLHEGRLVIEGSIEGLRNPDARQALIVDRLAESDQAALRGWLAERGHRLHGVAAAGSSLDEVFLRHTRGAKTEEVR